MSEPDLLALAATGRVKFHEAGEIVFTEGQKRGKYFFVVQQGSVHLFRNGARGEELVDIRVEGDLVGMFWIKGEPAYMHSARTMSDTLLYAFDRETFSGLVERYPAVTHYLENYFSVGRSRRTTPAESADKALNPHSTEWLLDATLIGRHARTRLLCCQPDQRVRDVALKMAPGNQEAVVVTDGSGLPLGIITESDLCGKVATGQISVEAPVSALMSTPVITVCDGLGPGELILKMLNCRLNHLCVTEDGSDQTPVIGLVGEKDLKMLFGRIPTFLTRELRAADDTLEMAVLRQRADALLLEYLQPDTPFEWLTGFVAEVDRVVLERALEVARNRLQASGRPPPGVEWCWLAFHSEGRKERFLRSAQRTGLVIADVASAQMPEVRDYFLQLAAEAGKVLAACGFPRGALEQRADLPQWCLFLSEWKQLFRCWIGAPVQKSLVNLEPFFDLRPVAGMATLADALREDLGRVFDEYPDFVPLMAKEAMASLPPVTIFKDSVIDKSGVLWTCIDTKEHALLPLVDLARVFALRYKFLKLTNTVDRFEAVQSQLPDHAALLMDAAEATKSILLLQTAHGLRQGNSGQFIRPADLAKIDRENLKSAFRTIAGLLELCTELFEPA